MRISSISVIALFPLLACGPSAAGHGITITEIHARPAPGGAAFVEIHNPSSRPFDLTGVFLFGGTDMFFAFEAGDVLVARGSVEATATPKAGGDPIEMSGHWMDYRRLQEDGSWKIVETIWVFDQPLPQE